MRSLAIDVLRVLHRHAPLDVAALAAACGASRASTTLCLGRLARLGLVHDDAGSVSPQAQFDFLDAATIAGLLGQRAAMLDVEVLDRCGSTSSLLLERARDAGRAVVLLTEEQTAGRGRRGRRWVSTPGAGLTLSLLRRMNCPVGRLAGLSLACGVALVRALRTLGFDDLHLKWPNDLLCGAQRPGAKLGGILVESRSRGAQTDVVVGIGVNCRPTPGLDARLRRKVAALAELREPPPRNAIAASVARELLAALDVFESAGLAAFRDEWESLHAHLGQRLRVRLSDGRMLAGIADGLAEDGGLLLRARSGMHSLHSGRVVCARAA